MEKCSILEKYNKARLFVATINVVVLLLYAICSYNNLLLASRMFMVLGVVISTLVLLSILFDIACAITRMDKGFKNK